MRKRLSVLLLAFLLLLCITCAQAEQDNFLVSDWMLRYAYGNMTIAEQSVFIYEDKTFEVMDEGESKKGSWAFDGSTLSLTADGETLSLRWNAEIHQFSGEFNGMTITMYVPIEPEKGSAAPDEPARNPQLTGGWTVAESPVITDEIRSLLWRALDSYQTGTITVSYTPVTYLGGQVVAGTNHAILCRSQEINHPAVWAVVYLYVDPAGNVSVLKIEELPLGV